jgi:hypothetical protein
VGEKNRTGIFVKPHQAAIVFDPETGQWSCTIPRGTKIDGSADVPRGVATVMAFMMQVQKGERQWMDDLISRWFKPAVTKTIEPVTLPKISLATAVSALPVIAANVSFGEPRDWRDDDDPLKGM